MVQSFNQRDQSNYDGHKSAQYTKEANVISRISKQLLKQAATVKRLDGRMNDSEDGEFSDDEERMEVHDVLVRPLR